MTNHDHEYYHDDCSLCRMENPATAKNSAIFSGIIKTQRELNKLHDKFLADTEQGLNTPNRLSKEYKVQISMEETGRVTMLLIDDGRTHSINTRDFSQLNNKSNAPLILGELIRDLTKEGIK